MSKLNSINKAWILKRFVWKDINKPFYFLGLEITDDNISLLRVLHNEQTI